jgi:hypothetical protein
MDETVASTAAEATTEKNTTDVSAGSTRPTRPANSYVPPSRVNKAGRTHHLPPAYWEILEEISFRTRDEKGKRVPQERLVAEALNLLFMKYNYPQVRSE